MEIFKLTDSNIPTVASFMCRIRPEWWDYNSAFGQLSNIDETIGTVGWFMGNDENHPKGWVFCRELKGYRSIELECCGYDDNGTFALEHKLKELFDTVCNYAISKEYLTFRTAMGSTQFSIHNRELANISDEIRNLKSYGRIDYDWLLDYGFRVVGIQPNALGVNYHCILLTKDLTK
ncbi:MAG TPA: hypothetical protein VHT96_08595 [Clostridia bacterium]|nr:hypothetical protein [Clostridia bacterium]